jgi:DNA-binding response OmpR family regulator
MKRHVLIIDDDALLLRSISRCLYRQPYTLFTAHDAAEAKEAIKAQRIDLVVVDQQMPGIKGTELARWIAGYCPSIKTIMLTGNASLETAMAAINQGNVFRFFTKPCDVVELALAIQQALQQKDREEASLSEGSDDGNSSATFRNDGFANRIQAEKAIADPFREPDMEDSKTGGSFARGILMIEPRARRALREAQEQRLCTFFDLRPLHRHEDWDDPSEVPEAVLLWFSRGEKEKATTICRGLKGIHWQNAPAILAFSPAEEDASIAAALGIGFDECLTPRMGPEEMVARILAAVRTRRLDQVLAGVVGLEKRREEATVSP